MYALLKPKSDNKYCVRKFKPSAYTKRNNYVIVYCDNRNDLQQICENLNHDVPRIQISKIRNGSESIRRMGNSSSSDDSRFVLASNAVVKLGRRVDAQSNGQEISVIPTKTTAFNFSPKDVGYGSTNREELKILRSSGHSSFTSLIHRDGCSETSEDRLDPNHGISELPDLLPPVSRINYYGHPVSPGNINSSACIILQNFSNGEDDSCIFDAEVQLPAQKLSPPNKDVLTSPDLSKNEQHILSSVSVIHPTAELGDQENAEKTAQKVNDIHTNVSFTNDANIVNEELRERSARFLTKDHNEKFASPVNVEIGAYVTLPFSSTDCPVREVDRCILADEVQSVTQELSVANQNVLMCTMSETNKQQESSSILAIQATYGSHELEKPGKTERKIHDLKSKVSLESLSEEIENNNTNDVTITMSKPRGQLSRVLPINRSGSSVSSVNVEASARIMLRISPSKEMGNVIGGNNVQSVVQRSTSPNRKGISVKIVEKISQQDSPSMPTVEVAAPSEDREKVGQSERENYNQHTSALSINTPDDMSNISPCILEDDDQSSTQQLCSQNPDILTKSDEQDTVAQTEREFDDRNTKVSSERMSEDTENIRTESHPSTLAENVQPTVHILNYSPSRDVLPTCTIFNRKTLQDSLSVTPIDVTVESEGEDETERTDRKIIHVEIKRSINSDGNLEILALHDDSLASPIKVVNSESDENVGVHFHRPGTVPFVVNASNVSLDDINECNPKNLTPVLSNSERHCSILTESADSRNNSAEEALRMQRNLKSVPCSVGNDDDWLPPEVQYKISALLEEILSSVPIEPIEDDDDTMSRPEQIRGAFNHRSDILSPVRLLNESNNIESFDSSSHSIPENCDLSLSNYIVTDYEDMENDEYNGGDIDYHPCNDSEDSDDSEYEKNTSNDSNGKRRKSASSSVNSSANTSSTLNISGKACRGACDNVDMVVKTSENKRSEKKYFCLYCKKLYSKIARHLEQVHKDELNVQKFASLPKASIERRQIIDILRKKGNFEYNTSSQYNKGDLIPARRPNPKYQRAAREYKTCPNCLDNYTIYNIRHHVKKCLPERAKAERSVVVLGRTVEGRLHAIASDQLRLVVFPRLRESDVVRAIRYDRLLIIWGNKLCVRYSPQYQHKGIRTRLRLMGRMLLMARGINSTITDCASMYDPKLYDDVAKAARLVGGYDENSGEFGAPAVGMNVGTYMKQIGDILINEYIKSEDIAKERKVEQFLKVFKVDFSVDVNKIALDTQRKNQRERKIDLPSTADIQKITTFLKTEIDKSFNKLLKSYSYDEWFKLAEMTMASLLIFNRRRTGEIENILITDYQKRESINENTDKEMYASLSAESKLIANKYSRIVIRGKLGRSVGVLLCPQISKSINLVLKHREEARVPDKNIYLFGLPCDNPKRMKVIDACAAMRKYSMTCGADFPETLRGTKLRKHIATKCVTLNLNDNEVTDLSVFLGHSEKIHKQYYRQPIKSREIIGISRLLEAAQGQPEDGNDSTDDDNPSNIDEPLQNYGSSENDRLSANHTRSSTDTNVNSDDEDVSNIPIVEDYNNNNEGLSIDDIEKSILESSAEDGSLCRKKTMKRRDQDFGIIKSAKRKRLSTKGSIKSTNSKQGKKKKSVSKMITDTTKNFAARNVKRPWSPELKELVSKVFSKHLKEFTLPSFAEIKEAKAKYSSALENRTLPQIKSWIDNQNKAVIRSQKGRKTKGG